MRVVVSGGGTAGHISPTLATSDALRALDPSVQILYVGQASGMEARIVTTTGLEFAAIVAGKFRRNHFASSLGKVLNIATIGPNIRDFFRTIRGVFQSVRILRSFRPAVVFLKGGYVCLPVGIAARILRIPFIIHESDVTPGLANRILSRWALTIAVGFPVKNYKLFDSARLVHVGNPVRRDILTAHRLEGLAAFKLDETVPVILVTGGSQGAVEINDLVLECLDRLLPNYQIIHQVGEQEIGRIQFEMRKWQKRPFIKHYHPVGFLTHDMGKALAAADLVIGRAGVNTINDSAVLGKPMILIPNYQMAGHQVENAKVLSRQGAARVLNGASLTSDQLVAEIERIMKDETEQTRLSEAIRSFGRVDAAQELARLILEVGKEHEKVERKPNTDEARHE